MKLGLLLLAGLSGVSPFSDCENVGQVRTFLAFPVGRRERPDERKLI